MENPKQLTPEEIAEMEKSRTISDAELLKGGAEYVVDEKGENKNLLATEEQKSKIKNPYEIEARRKKLFEKDLEDFRNWVNFSIKMGSEHRMSPDDNIEHSVRYINGSAGEIRITYSKDRRVITDLYEADRLGQIGDWRELFPTITLHNDNGDLMFIDLGIDDLQKLKLLIEKSLSYSYHPEGKYYNPERYITPSGSEKK